MIQMEIKSREVEALLKEKDEIQIKKSEEFCKNWSVKKTKTVVSLDSSVTLNNSTIINKPADLINRFLTGVINSLLDRVVIKNLFY